MSTSYRYLRSNNVLIVTGITFVQVRVRAALVEPLLRFVLREMNPRRTTVAVMIRVSSIFNRMLQLLARTASQATVREICGWLAASEGKPRHPGLPDALARCALSPEPLWSSTAATKITPGSTPSTETAYSSSPA